ncbi:MAG: AgmX/PglI C-terminal domain-containing protein [Deltaproteobacteria bacterium]|nr:AgmX/PglI C-terminal domain-containing protein [Deltaproteobacteria bacterium]
MRRVMSKRLIVTTHYAGQSKSQVWDIDRPVQVHRPFQLSLRQSNGEIVLTDAAGIDSHVGQLPLVNAVNIVTQEGFVITISQSRKPSEYKDSHGLGYQERDWLAASLVVSIILSTLFWKELSVEKIGVLQNNTVAGNDAAPVEIPLSESMLSERVMKMRTSSQQESIVSNRAVENSDSRLKTRTAAPVASAFPLSRPKIHPSSVISPSEGSRLSLRQHSNMLSSALAGLKSSLADVRSSGGKGLQHHEKSNVLAGFYGIPQKSDLTDIPRAVDTEKLSQEITSFRPDIEMSAQRLPIAKAVGTQVSQQGRAFVQIEGESVQLNGTLTREQVSSVIQSRLSEVRQCYEFALGNRSQFRGRLVIHFKIRPDGSIANTSVNGQEQDESLNRCLINRIATWKFPKIKGGQDVEVAYPFVFLALEEES